MLNSLLSLPVHIASKLDQYAIKHSTTSTLLKQHYEWTKANFADADRSSSLLQVQWMMLRAREMKPAKILDVGCYTGLSAIAFYEGTSESETMIQTIEYDAKLAQTARETFKRLGCDDRIKVIEAPAQEALQEMQDPFDIIFIDLEFSMYRPITELILDRGLLSSKGVILVDNVFARGFAVDDANEANIDPAKLSHWIDAGRQVRDFNSFVAADPRVDVNMLPFFDGVSEIRLNPEQELKRH